MEGEGDRGEGRAVKEREARSEKVILADPIRGSHLLILLSAREALTQAKPAVSQDAQVALPLCNVRSGRSQNRGRLSGRLVFSLENALLSTLIRALSRELAAFLCDCRSSFCCALESLRSCLVLSSTASSSNSSSEYRTLMEYCLATPTSHQPAEDAITDPTPIPFMAFFMEEGGVVLVQDELCSAGQHEQDCSHMSLSCCDVEGRVLLTQHTRLPVKERSFAQQQLYHLGVPLFGGQMERSQALPVTFV
ncbi:hypothetical protein EYF80_000841 [Liparis tanakae]|uniref:Uncharacterized protein n=1 Tax=Liparis tanakae TaxID=230148 RepID=A0A4Z2JGH0_9TELE|nr:hypothetical protein EYF80_000841 [Liparis tanakae]